MPQIKYKKKKGQVFKKIRLPKVKISAHAKNTAQPNKKQLSVNKRHKSIIDHTQDLEQASKFITELKQALSLAELGNYPLDSVPGMVSTLTQPMLVKHLNKILGDDDTKLLNRLIAIEPGGPHPLILPRELEIDGSKSKQLFKHGVLRDIDGSYLYAIFFKGKRTDFTKRKMLREQGAEKTCKLTIIITKDKPKLYAELIIATIAPESIASEINKIKTRYRQQTGKICNPEHAAELIAAKFQPRITRHRKIIETQQIFHNILGFAPVIYAGLTTKKVIYNQDGAALDIPQIIVLSPYRNLLLSYIEKKWIPEGYDTTSNDENFEIRNSKLVMQMIDIINIMHSHRIEHGDIKIDNFLLNYDRDTGDLNLEITDFGTIKAFDEADGISGTPEFISPKQLQIYFHGSSIYDIENLAYSQREEKFLRVMQSYGWRRLKEMLIEQGLSVTEKIPNLVEDVVDGSNDIWSFGCTYYHMVYGTDINNSLACETVVNNDSLLKAVLHSPKPPTASELLDLYKQTSYYKTHYAKNIQKPTPILTKQNSPAWIEAPLANVEQFVGHDDAKRKHTGMSRNQKIAAIQQLITLLPNSPDITELVASLATTRSIKRLNEIANQLETLAKSEHTAQQTNVKLSDKQWAEKIGKRQLGLNIALILTYKLIDYYQEKSLKTARSLLFSCIPTSKRTEVIKHTHEIKKYEANIKDLAPAVRESLSIDSFVAKYAAKQ